MSGIAEASQEQSAGIEQVNQAVGQMDEVTQQNAALVEEAAAASESMQVQAIKLSQLVSGFKLIPGGRTGQIAARSAPVKSLPAQAKPRRAMPARDAA